MLLDETLPGNGEIRIGISGDTDVNYVLEATTNLTHWLPISTNTIWSQPMVDATGAQPPHRFYRLRAK